MTEELLSISKFIPEYQKKPETKEQLIISSYMHINVKSFFDTMCSLNPDDLITAKAKLCRVNMEITSRKHIKGYLSHMTIGQLLSHVRVKFYVSYGLVKQRYPSYRRSSEHREKINERNTAADYLVSAVLLKPFMFQEYLANRVGSCEIKDLRPVRKRYTMKEFLSDDDQIRNPEDILRLVAMMSKIPMRSLYQKCASPVEPHRRLFSLFMELKMPNFKTWCPKVWENFDLENFSDQPYGMFAYLLETYRINQHYYANYHYDEPSAIMVQLTQISTGFAD